MHSARTIVARWARADNDLSVRARRKLRVSYRPRRGSSGECEETRHALSWLLLAGNFATWKNYLALFYARYRRNAEKIAAKIRAVRA